jgi:hypothetical protein
MARRIDAPAARTTRPRWHDPEHGCEGRANLPVPVAPACLRKALGGITMPARRIVDPYVRRGVVANAQNLEWSSTRWYAGPRPVPIEMDAMVLEKWSRDGPYRAER